MSSEVTRTDVQVPQRLGRHNTMAFPRELREAIPDLPTCVGRLLELSSMSGQPSNTHLFGPRVHVSLVVNETGKLTGKFTVRIDLQTDAARALAETLTKLADQAEQLEPGLML